MRIAFPGDSLIRVPVPDAFSEMMSDSLNEVYRLQLEVDDLSV